MKQIATIFLIFFFNSLILAQESDAWPKPGAEWSYCVYGNYPDFPVWSHTFAYTADTVIGLHTYAMVQHTEVNGQPLAEDGSSWWNPEENMRTFCRQSGDTIYRHVNGQDYIFMVNGIQSDDEFPTFRSTHDDWGQWNCTEVLPLRVISAEEMEYGNETYREVTLQDLDPYFGPEYETENIYSFIEGVGLKNGFIFFTPGLVSAAEPNQSGDLFECLGGVFHLPSSSLYHYRDDETEIELFNCNTTVATNDITDERYSLSLFPNPAKDMVTIETTGDGQQSLQVALYDVRGVLLKQYFNVMSGTQLDLGKTTKGIYLIRVESDSGVSMQKLVLR